MATTWWIGLVPALIAALELMASPLPEQEHAAGPANGRTPERPLRDMRQFLVPFSVSRRPFRGPPVPPWPPTGT